MGINECYGFRNAFALISNAFHGSTDPKSAGQRAVTRRRKRSRLHQRLLRCNEGQQPIATQQTLMCLLPATWEIKKRFTFKTTHVWGPKKRGNQ